MTWILPVVCTVKCKCKCSLAPVLCFVLFPQILLSAKVVDNMSAVTEPSGISSPTASSPSTPPASSPTAPTGESPTAQAAATNTKLFIGQIPTSMTEEHLKPIFDVFGTVMNIQIIRDRNTGGHKASAFVSYNTVAEAQVAIDNLHNLHVIPPMTNPLQVGLITFFLASPLHPRQPHCATSSAVWADSFTEQSPDAQWCNGEGDGNGCRRS